MTAFQPVRPVSPVFPQRAAVIIDGGYWEILRKATLDEQVNLLTLSDDLCRPAFRLRTYYFDGKDQKRLSLHDTLKLKDRFEVLLGDVITSRMKCSKCLKSFSYKQQKRVDMLIAVKMVHLASTRQVDMIVLLAGDRDFVPVVAEAKNAGVIVKLAHGDKEEVGVASDLMQEADELVCLTKDYLKKFPLEKTVHIPKVPEEVKVIEPTKETKEQVLESIIELMVKQNSERIRASDLGLLLQEKEIILDSKLKDILEIENTRISLKQEENELFISFIRTEEKEIVKDKQKKIKEDSALDLLLTSIAETLKEKNKDRITLLELGNTMKRKENNWKEKYGYSKLSKLINRAKDVIIIEEKEGKIIVGLKPSNQE